MRWKDISEMPVQNMHHFTKPGDETGKTRRTEPLQRGPEAFASGPRSSFRKKADKKLASNVKRVTKAFAKSEHDFDFYFVNSPEANKHTEVGMVSPEWLRTQMPEFWKIFHEKWNEDHISIIFTNNKGANWVPMTPWIMAHRIGHASRRDENFFTSNRVDSGYDAFVKEFMHWVNEIFQNVYDTHPVRSAFPWRREEQLKLKHFYEMIGTFKSARQKNLRDYFEMYNELIAQYLIKGEVKFNTLEPSFGNRRNMWRTPHDQEDLQQLSEDYLMSMEDMVQTRIANIFWGLEGKILVM